RRRHTRFSRDWSSDVCSSDLEYFLGESLGHPETLPPGRGQGNPAIRQGSTQAPEGDRAEFRSGPRTRKGGEVMWETRAQLKAQIKELKAELEKLNDHFDEAVEREVQEQVSDFVSLYRQDLRRFAEVAEALGISPQAGGETAVAKIRALQDDIEELFDALREAEKEKLRLKRKYR